MERERPHVEVEHPRSPYCRDAVRPEQEKAEQAKRAKDTGDA